MIDLYTPPLWTPPKPAIIRAVEIERAPLPLGAMLPGLVPVIARNVAGFDLSFVGSPAVQAANLTIYTFSATAIGAASASRHVIVAVIGNATSSATISSVTVDGVSATEVLTSLSATGTNRTSLWISANPTNTSGDIIVTWSGGVANCAIAVYRMVNAISATPTATVSDTTPASNILDGSLTINASGGGIGVALTNGDVAPRTHTWTNLTEDVDAVVEGNRAFTTAKSMTAGSATRSVTASGALSNGGAIFAAWA